VGRADRVYRVPQPDQDAPDNQQETLMFLADHRLLYVCVDMPQGYRDSIPLVLAATAPDLAAVRLHGHSDKWESKDIHERFGYQYTEAEPQEWYPRCAPWPAMLRTSTCCSTTATATTPTSTPSGSPNSCAAKTGGDLLPPAGPEAAEVAGIDARRLGPPAASDQAVR
jgi:Protein of unknown function DUF72